jgi:hypothetical protein
VQQPWPVLLVHEQVGEVRDRHPPRALPVAPDAQHHLLRSHAADEEHRGGLVQQLGHLAFEHRDRAAVAVPVPLLDAEAFGIDRESGEGVGG